MGEIEYSGEEVMDRRGFLRSAGMALIGAGLVRVPLVQEIVPVAPTAMTLADATLTAIWPKMIADNFFRESPFMSYLRSKGAIVPFSGGTEYKLPFYFEER